MLCSHCQTSMSQTDQVTESHTRQTWYHCPSCDATQTVTQPFADAMTRIGNTQRYSAAREDDNEPGLSKKYAY